MTRTASMKRTHLQAGFDHSQQQHHKKKVKHADKSRNKIASEQRRLRRIDEKKSNTVCFACRETGHSASNCPNSTSRTGICYNCGSAKHSLSRCKKPRKPDGSLPFASCFVCSSKGHLAGTCPDNSAKGVYPNGGCCKLCSEKTHLAKDCPLRQQDSVKDVTVFGTGREAGADEDDFHILKRNRNEVERDERGEERRRRAADVRTGALSGVVKAFGQTPAKPKKVVYF
ncbi:hypothetical protein HMN09_00083000 [Mycena chlorophos]|uniref:CCHC-type domain-containing protein n=1 Tax=Mycena chlorophos TaxID=658473 RepID=A0A8H6TUF9_MYCCL|nr:hypothetical protein HMN09_00083000 [Mycena chlorophos]